jgi:lipoyl(octanoyl) transferase
LNYFKNIIPCGIDDKEVASMHTELGRSVDIEEVKTILKSKIEEVFGLTLIN